MFSLTTRFTYWTLPHFVIHESECLCSLVLQCGGEQVGGAVHPLALRHNLKVESFHHLCICINYQLSLSNVTIDYTPVLMYVLVDQDTPHLMTEGHGL